VVRPGDERNAQDDGEATHQQPQLAGEQALPAGTQHGSGPLFDDATIEQLHPLKHQVRGRLAQLVHDPVASQLCQNLVLQAGQLDVAEEHLTGGVAVPVEIVVADLLMDSPVVVGGRLQSAFPSRSQA
jgi:hypothetical protein